MDKNSIRYLNSMSQAGAMLKKGLLNQKEYILIEEKIALKYGQDLTSIYRLNDLTNPLFRVINMIQKKEVDA